MQCPECDLEISLDDQSRLMRHSLSKTPVECPGGDPKADWQSADEEMACREFSAWVESDQVWDHGRQVRERAKQESWNENDLLSAMFRHESIDQISARLAGLSDEKRAERETEEARLTLITEHFLDGLFELLSDQELQVVKLTLFLASMGDERDQEICTRLGISGPELAQLQGSIEEKKDQIPPLPDLLLPP